MRCRSLISPRLAVCTLLTLCGSPLLAQTAPSGWTKSSDDKAGTITLKPSDLKAGEVLMVRFYKRELLEGQSLEQWMSTQFQNRKPPSGKWAGEGKVEKNTANIASATRSYRDDQGKEGMLMLTGVSVDGQSARMVALVLNSMDAMKRHKDAAMQAVGQLVEIEKKAAVEDDRGLQIEAAPPSVKGIKAGGPIKPGRYKGNMITTWDNTVLRGVEVIVFENGEFEFLQGEQWRDATGKYKYSPTTGRFDAQDPLYNSTYHPDEDFCVYGTEADGTSVIYAEDDAGTSIHKTRLRWVGAVDRDPPSVVEQRKKEAEIEAARYKFVVEPGKGVKDDEIECILSVVDYKNDGMNSRAEGHAYLLMRDGRVMDGLPVPPNELDLAMTRSQEPDRWGYWRRKDGKYEFAWPSRPNDYNAPKGFQTIGQPIAKGTTLESNFKGASSWGMVGGMGGANFWGVRFGAKGRFEKWKHGISGTGTPVFEGQTSVGTAYDDKGSATVVSGGGIGGGTISKNNNPDAHRMGWYEFDGYTLTLKFDNGKVSRLATFMSPDKKSLWFEGGELSLEEEKK